MNETVKRAVAKMAAAFSHVGIAVNTVPWFNEHIRGSVEWVHLYWWSDAVAVNALERSLRKTEPFLQRKNTAKGCGIGSNAQWRKGGRRKDRRLAAL